MGETTTGRRRLSDGRHRILRARLTRTLWPAALCALASLLTGRLAAQEPADDATPDSGLDASISLDSNHGRDGTWLQLTPGVSYTFNPRWSAEAGVPLYYLSPGATYEGTVALGGIGDVYGSVSLDMSSDAVTFYTTVTASAPTGSVDKGLGAGQMSWDWTGHLAGELGRFGPYVTGGVANNVKTANESLAAGAGTARPASGISVGNLAHAETGLEIGIWKFITLTASGYGVFALKDQAVATPRAPRPRPGINGPRPGARRAANPGGVLSPGFSPAASDAVSDHGVGLVLWDPVTPSLDVSLWFSHSLAYANYTTVSVSATYSWNRPGEHGRPSP